jgi:hypothetical protein
MLRRGEKGKLKMAVRQKNDRFFDHFEQRWRVRPDDEPEGGFIRANRRDIIQHIINNAFEPDIPVAGLYALLFVRTLCQADPELMREFGREVAELTKR